MTLRYYCPSCRTPSNSVRCSRCGGDTLKNTAASFACENVTVVTPLDTRNSVVLHSTITEGFRK